MSLIHDYHDERKARLVRLGARECPGCIVLRKGAAEKDKAFAALISEQSRELATKSAAIDRYKGRIEALEYVINNNSAMADAAASVEAEAAAQAFATARKVAPTVLSIVKATCDHFGRTYADIVSPRRDMSCVAPRHVAMYLAKTLTSQSFPEIGRRMGDRDHTTVLFAVRKIKALIEQQHPIAKDVEIIRSKFGAP